MIYDLFDFTKQTGIAKQTLITSYNISINSQPNAKNGCDIGLCWFNVSYFPDHFVIGWNCKKTNGLELHDWENLFAMGTHNNHGGDDPYYELGFHSNRNGRGTVVPNQNDLNEYINNWHMFQIEFDKEKNQVCYYQDGKLFYTYQYYWNPNIFKCFYINGTGFGDTMRWLTTNLWISNDRAYDFPNILYLKNNYNAYGIIKTEEGE